MVIMRVDFPQPVRPHTPIFSWPLMLKLRAGGGHMGAGTGESA
jgi:hypothetical protein